MHLRVLSASGGLWEHTVVVRCENTSKPVLCEYPYCTINPSRCQVSVADDVGARDRRGAGAAARYGAVLRHASHVLASWPAWRRRLAFARGRRAQNWRATPSGHSRGRCAPTAACKCAAASNPRKREPRSSPDRGTRALRASSHRRARTPDSLRVVCLPSVPQSTPEGAERRRPASLGCRSSSTTMFESGAARR